MSKRVQLFCEGTPITKQSFKAECDLNLIMKRFRNVQGVDFINVVKSAVGGQYGDFSNVPDYRAALDVINGAERVFMALPSKVRARFQNDPALFLDFFGDPKNQDEAIALGLATKREPKKETPVEVVEPSAVPRK